MAFYNFTPPLKPIEIADCKFLLRAPVPNDFSAWKQVREASREFLEPWEPRWPANDLTKLGFRRRLKRYELERERGTGETYFLIEKATGQPLGGISISNIRHGVARMCNIGYWMGEAYAGKGNMKKALPAICNHIFADLNLCRIEAACLPNNSRSSHLLEGAGFQQEGLLRQYLEINGIRQDHLLYSLLQKNPTN